MFQSSHRPHVHPKFDHNTVFPIFSLTFVDILGLTLIFPLLHLYALNFGAGPLEIGLVVAAFPLAQVLGVPVMGALSDRDRDADRSCSSARFRR